MNIKKTLIYTSIFLLVNGFLYSLRINGQEKEKPLPISSPIRIGVVSYGDYDHAYSEYQQFFNKLLVSDKSSYYKENRPGFQLAIGSYDDVFSWYKNGYVDLAILSTGAVGELLAEPDGERQLTNLYIGTKKLNPIPGGRSFANSIRQNRNFSQLEYQAVCLVKKNSNIKTFNDLLEKARVGEVDFLFVDPLSVSGRILPEYILRKNGIDINRNKVEWTYGHTRSVELLKEADSGNVNKVAFVWDDATSDTNAYKKIPIPELEQNWIPQEVIMLHPNFAKYKDEVKKLLSRSDKIDDNQQDWLSKYQKVVGWIKSLKLSPNEESQRSRTLDQIISKVLEYDRYHPGQTRLALVLSGGGAKCAYQIGATEAIEDALGRAKLKDNKRLDFDLIVGTSGGAINALVFALGLEHTSDGRQRVRDTWLSFDQGDFFRPWEPLPIVVGVTLGLFQTIIVIFIIPLFSMQPISWWRYAEKSVLGLLFATITLVMLGLTSWSLIPATAISLVIAVTLLNNAPPKALLTAGGTLIIIGSIELLIAFVRWTPWKSISIIFWFLLVVTQLVGLILVVRLLAPNKKNWWIPVCSALIALLGIEIFLAHQELINLAWINNEGRNHLLRHIWILITLNLYATALVLILTGIALLFLSRRWLSSQEIHIVRRRVLKWATVVMLLLVAFQFRHSVLYDDTLSDTSGIESVFARSMPTLLSNKSEIKPQGNSSLQLKAFSKEIIDQGLLTHNLIITSSRLPTSNDFKGKNSSLPQELYFYYQLNETDLSQQMLVPPNKRFPSDPRFISLQNSQYKENLLDIVIGSSSIYPVFRPRLLPSSNNSADEMLELIDGGFAHNSPVEAAVAWGATHIILIEASPEEEPSVRSNLLSNSGTAFNYLFSQAQLLDVHSRGKVEIYTLRPELAHSDMQINLCTFDFSDTLTQEAMDSGLRDALDSNTPRFHREGGQPLF